MLVAALFYVDLLFVTLALFGAIVLAGTLLTSCIFCHDGFVGSFRSFFGGPVSVVVVISFGVIFCGDFRRCVFCRSWIMFSARPLSFILLKRT